WGLRVSAYEFTDESVLKALKDAHERKADVQILYHAKNDAQKKLNEARIAKFGMGDYCHARVSKGLTLSHNKIIVLTKKGVAQAVLTGSTNFSVGGIYGHSNVVHISEENRLSKKYLWLWNELSKNEETKVVAPVLATASPLPVDTTTAGTIPIFSPRPNLEALEYYAARATEANDALFMTFAFGMHPMFQDAYRNGTAKLRYALMEKMSGPTKTAAEREANEAKIISLRKLVQNKFAIGAFLPLGAFDHWLRERLTGLNVNVRYLHTKYMLIDPLGRNPLVVTGSANFSVASTENNDENMLAIRGDTRVTDIYLGEFMRLYNHFAFRDFLSNAKNPNEAEVSHLDETDKWWKRYFGKSFAARQREYFAG
ncbi:MAG: phospholipase D-like domain-containing protein, partial [Gemmatimonadaceae bacterium]